MISLSPQVPFQGHHQREGMPVHDSDPFCTVAYSLPPHSFFDNKGAVAAVFTIVGLVGLAILIAVATIFMRRRARRQDVEDEIYFEKYQDPAPTGHDDHYNNSNDFGGMGQDATDVITHASPDSYPDRNVHYGNTPSPNNQMYDYGNPQEYGVEYPPGTAYAAAAAQQGQYQYGVDQSQGQGAYGGGYNYNNAGAGGDQYYNSQARTSPGPHPFADPSNVTRQTAAPPVGGSPTNLSYDHDDAYGGMGNAR